MKETVRFLTFQPRTVRKRFVNCTEARARGGEGPPWGFTVIPLVGDTCRAMQPQSCPSPRVVPTVTSRAAPGSVPGVDVHVRETVMYVLRLEADSHACLSDGWACVHTGHTTFASDPQSGQRSCLATLQCLPSMSVSHSSITCAPQTEWGGGGNHGSINWSRCHAR